MQIKTAQRNWFLNAILQEKEPELLGGTADSRAGIGRLQNEPETSYSIRK